MTERQNLRGPKRASHLWPQSAASRSARPGTLPAPGQLSPVFHYETDRYRLVTPGWPEVTEARGREEDETLD